MTTPSLVFRKEASDWRTYDKDIFGDKKACP